MKVTEQYADVEIIEKIIAGEIALFEVLIRRYNSFLYKTGRSYNYNHEDTQDLMQDTFIDTYTNLAKFEGRSSFKTWIIKIMLNNCFRKKQRSGFKNEVKNEITDKSIPMFSNKHTDTGKMTTNKELSRVIETALQHLPLDYRMVFSLRVINGLNVSEAAEALDTNNANIKTRLSRAKTMLRKEIEKSYSTEDIFEFNLIYCDAMTNNVMNKIKNIIII